MPTKAQRKAFMAKAKAKKEAQKKEQIRQQSIIDQFAKNDLFWIKILSLCRKHFHQGPKWVLQCRLICQAANKGVLKMPGRTWWYWNRTRKNTWRYQYRRTMRLRRNMFMVNLNRKIHFISFLQFQGSRKKLPKYFKEKYGPHLYAWARIKEKFLKTGNFPKKVKGAEAERSKNTLTQKLLKRNYWLKNKIAQSQSQF